MIAKIEGREGEGGGGGRVLRQLFYCILLMYKHKRNKKKQTDSLSQNTYRQTHKLELCSGIFWSGFVRYELKEGPWEFLARGRRPMGLTFITSPPIESFLEGTLASRRASMLSGS